MTNEEMPPMTLTESAIGLHEFYLCLTNAGFTDEQAMYLVGEMVVSSVSDDYYDD